MTGGRIRVIERWGLVAGVTGVAANVLLIALYALALPGVGDYDWTGAANDVMGGLVSTGATIPVALALGELVGRRSLVRAATLLAAFAMAAIVASSLLLVVDVIPFERQVFIAIPALVVMLVWTAVIGRAGAATGSLPPGLARLAVAIGVSGCLGMALVGSSVLVPLESVVQYVVGGAGLLVGIPAFLAFPIWLILLSNWLRAHLAGAGKDGFPTGDPLDISSPEPAIGGRAR
jgi:hypothetical protein